MPKKILITAGGTGGHVYPAQGFAQQLKKSSSDHEILFVAGGLQTNRYFERDLFPYQEVTCSPLVHMNPFKVCKGLLNLRKGVNQSLDVIKHYKPDVVVGFGSYYTLPILIAAKLSKTPIVLHEANSIPGKANKWFAPYVNCVGVHFPSTKLLLSGNAVEVGLPLREGYHLTALTHGEALAYFELDASLPVLLIFGGSQGAKAINLAMKACLETGWNLAVQIIHITGNEEMTHQFKSSYANQGIRACVKTFEKQMDKAWRAADIFIGRSGAATIAEALEFEVPGILIPYPHATENHQEWNADFLVETVSGAVKCCENQLTAVKLKAQLAHLLNKEQKEKMKSAMRLYKTRPGRVDLCQIVLDIAHKYSRRK